MLSPAKPFPMPPKRGRGRPRKYPLPEGFVKQPSSSSYGMNSSFPMDSGYSVGSFSSPSGGSNPYPMISMLNSMATSIPNVVYLDYFPDTEQKQMLKSGSVIKPEEEDGFFKLRKILQDEDEDNEEADSKYSGIPGADKVGVTMFQLINHHEKDYFAVALDLARHLGFRDSYTFFNKTEYSFDRIWADEVERAYLVDVGALSPSMRQRNIAVVNVRPVFKVYGDNFRLCNNKNPQSNVMSHVGSGEFEDDQQQIGELGASGSGIYDDDQQDEVNLGNTNSIDDEDELFTGRFRKRLLQEAALYNSNSVNRMRGHVEQQQKSKRWMESIPETFAFNESLHTARKMRLIELCDLNTGYPLTPFEYLNSANRMLNSQAHQDFENMISRGDNKVTSSKVGYTNSFKITHWDDYYSPSEYPIALMTHQRQDRFPLYSPVWSNWYQSAQAHLKKRSNPIQLVLANTEQPLQPRNVPNNVVKHQPVLIVSNPIMNSTKAIQPSTVEKDLCQICKSRVYAAAKNNPLRTIKVKDSASDNNTTRPYFQCSTCKKYFHRNCCLQEARKPNSNDKMNYNERFLTAELESNKAFPQWQCLDCKSCYICLKVSKKKNDDDIQFITCDSCDSGFHIDCLEPPLPPAATTTKEERWICAKCVQCKNCSRKCENPRSSVPPSEFQHIYAKSPIPNGEATSSLLTTLCSECLGPFEKGEFCMVCLRNYPREDQDQDDNEVEDASNKSSEEEYEMVACDTCDRWVHASCDQYARRILLVSSSEQQPSVTKSPLIKSPRSRKRQRGSTPIDSPTNSQKYSCPICRQERGDSESELEDTNGGDPETSSLKRKRGRPRKLYNNEDNSEEQEETTSNTRKNRIKPNRKIAIYQPPMPPPVTPSVKKSSKRKSQQPPQPTPQSYQVLLTHENLPTITSLKAPKH